MRDLFLRGVTRVGLSVAAVAAGSAVALGALSVILYAVPSGPVAPVFFLFGFPLIQFLPLAILSDAFERRDRRLGRSSVATELGVALACWLEDRQLLVRS